MGGMSNTGWMRNYTAMGDQKLMRCVREFQAGYGDAINRVEIRGGSVEDNRAKCEYVAMQKGLIDSAYQPTGTTEAITEPKFCPECERKKAFLLDDYVCRDCRKAMDGDVEEVVTPDPIPPTDAADALAKSLGNL